MYKLTEEPDLTLSFLCSMDGNNSLKLVDSSVRFGSSRLDERQHRIKDLFLSPEEVDRFKDEVTAHRSAKVLPALSRHSPDYIDINA
jgi:hypothetical protein